jgi:uncharacterized membrane protein YphA (DoxX/SURF4 family)
MKKFSTLQPWATLAARILLGVVLLLAGYLKAKSPAQAQMAVRAYKLLPIFIANIFGLSLPWLEIGAGILLIVGIAVRYAALFGGLLMLLFVAAISQSLGTRPIYRLRMLRRWGQVAAGHTKYLQEIVRDLGTDAHGSFSLSQSTG